MDSNIKKLAFAGICTSVGIILPSLFHIFGIGVGTVFLPMHIPVLLCGLVCGYKLGGLSGALVPLLCSIFTGSPPLYPIAVSMMFELCAYGIFTGLLIKKWNIYISLIGAMLVGRIVGGIASLVFLGMAGKAYTMSIFLTSSFVTAFPGIIIQLVAIPILVVILQKAKLISFGIRGNINA